MRKPPIIHSTRMVDDSRFLRVEQIDLEFSNGERRTYERLKGSGLGAVIIVPIRDDDTVLLRVKRHGDGNVCHTGARSCFFRSLNEAEPL